MFYYNAKFTMNTEPNSESIFEKIKEQKTLYERILYIKNNFCNRIDFITKISGYSNLDRTTIGRYFKGTKAMRLQNIGLLIMAMKKYLEKDINNQGLADAVTIENLSTDLAVNEYQQTLRVQGVEQLIKKLSENILENKTENHESFENKTYTLGLINDWEESLVGDKLLKDMYTPLSLKISNKNIDNVLDEWVKNPEAPASFMLFGDTGIGKTTCLRSFVARQAERHIQNPKNEPLPIYIDVSKIERAGDITTVLESLLSYYFQQQISDMDHLFRLSQNGRIVFVVDGFDEMADRLSENTLFEHLIQIERLYHEKGKLILSSRKQLFSSTEQVGELFDKTKLGNPLNTQAGAPKELDNFNKDDIENYLKRYFDNDQKKIDELKALPGFDQISSHPMILEIMVQITPELKKLGDQTNKDLTKADVFSIYYDKWYNRKQSRRIIESTNLKMFCQELAKALWKFEQPKISYAMLKEEIGKYFNPNDPKVYENFTMAISNDSFLSRNNNDWCFLHEMFYYYFLALAISNSEDPINILQEKELTFEVFEFLK